VTTYTAVFENAPDGYVWGWIPEIPGATGTGQTIEEAEANLKAGLAAWIETEREFGRPIPTPSILGTRPVSTDCRDSRSASLSGRSESSGLGPRFQNTRPGWIHHHFDQATRSRPFVVGK